MNEALDGRDLSLDDVRRTALVGAGTCLAFAPMHTIFTDGNWVIESLGAVLCVLGPAAVLRLYRGPRLAQLVPGLVLLLIYTTALYLHGSAWAGIVPGPGSWHALGDLRADAREQIRDSSAPLSSTVALRVGVVPALGLLAALVDWMAVVRRAPALAGVPLLALFTICGATAGSSVGWFPFAIAATGFLVILSADARINLLRWGRVVSRPHSDRAARPALGRSGRRIGVIAVVAAVIVPTAVPGLSRNLLVDAFHPGSGVGTQGTGLSPFASLKGQLTQTSAIRLATVQVTGTADPFYLRSKVLNIFTDSGWSAYAQEAYETLDPGNLADGRVDSLTTTQFTAVVKIDKLADSAVPVFGAPARLTGLGQSWQWDPVDATVSGDRTRPGLTYTESVRQPDPSAAELDAASRPADQADFSSLPPDLPALVGSTVATVTAGATTPYARARALTDYFLQPANGFTYDLQTKAGDSGSDLVDFLTNKTGYCQQYAAALGVMLRVAGIPSRVVLGYTHPGVDKAGQFVVTSHDAHAWVEGYFTGLGWIPFDPTPLDAGRVTQLQYAPHPTAAALSAVPTQAEPSNSASAAQRRDQEQSSAAAAGVSTATRGPLVPAWLRTALLVVIVLVLVLLVLPVLRRVRQRARFRQAMTSGRLEPLWQELYATAVDTGAGWDASTTPRQVPTWLAGAGLGTTTAVTELARAVERERYASDATEHASAGAVNDSIDRLTVTARALRARLRPVDRVRAALWPRSLVRSSPIRFLPVRRLGVGRRRERPPPEG